ncbi:MAG: hypothetical protein V7K53_00145 [Nostoc sp.]|uniref:hypothetical protein n=1 Tax=Nostoc sp. TaxID=1180 RepID=UPI002FF6A5F5
MAYPLFPMAIALSGCPQRSRMRLVERRNDVRKCLSKTSNRFNSRDYVITLLRYHCAPNDNLRGL